MPWPNRYIYSYNDFSNASREQRTYYFYFRDCFLRRIPVDLKGNTNYAFILLFDILQEYNRHRNISQLQDEITALSKEYPITAVYARNELVQRLREKTRGALTDKYPQATGHTPVRPSTLPSNPAPIYVPAYPAMGTKFKDNIALSEAEEKMLNRLYYGSNIFFSNEFCQQVIVSVFIKLIRRLTNQVALENRNLNDVFTKLADVIARKHYHYRIGSENYKYSITNSNQEIMIILMKMCENAVREQYEFKRRLNVQSQYSNQEIQSSLETMLLIPANKLLSDIVRDAPTPDESTEVYLNKQNTTRWKARLDELKTIYKVEKNSNAFIKEVLDLARRNKANPSLEHIFFEASKFIGKDNKTACLSLYAHYIYYDQRSVKVDDKSLNKTLLKSLFNRPDQEQAFEAILLRLKTDKDLQKALIAILALFELKRKKIRLNDTRIEKAETAYTETVELLNDYLTDEQEAEASIQQIVNATPNPTGQMLTPSAPDSQESVIGGTLKSALQLNSLQKALLILFIKHNLLLSASDLDDFAKEKGAFKNQLIDSINEACYETIDDVLIEEEDENYVIQERYFQRVLPI